MLERRNGKLPISTGPARLCQAMGIGKEENNADLVTSNLYIAKAPKDHRHFRIVQTPRIGIDYADEAKDFLWRFLLRPKT